MEKYFHHSVFNLYLDQSHIHDAGLGVFTKDFIPKGVFIDEYIGEKYNFQSIGSYVLEVNEGYFIDSENFPRCFMAMINDCNYISKKIIKKGKKRINITPDFYQDKNKNILMINCEFRKNKEDKIVKVYSIHDIEKGAELFISYGPNYWIN